LLRKQNKNKCFFIVDDDVDDQELMIEAISQIDKSIQCIRANNGEDALKILKQRNPELPDFIFLDLNMPRLNGKECLAELKKNKNFREIPVIIFSTSALSSDIKESRALGAADFLTKPSRFSELCDLLSSVIKKDWSSNNHSSSLA
jgi:CheY-like chemotaxis protein